jgi:thymidine kinase
MIGILTTIVGPMFSGKTTELLRIMDREVIAKRYSILFKPKIDNRYSEESVINHNGFGKEAIIAEDADHIFEIFSNLNESNRVINVFIDEIQFFESNILKIIKDLKQLGVNIYVSGLNQTYKGDPFPFKDNDNHIGYLMAISDYVISIDAVCNVCGNKATKTYRLGSDTETVVVGGQDKYQARCVNCFEK